MDQQGIRKVRDHFLEHFQTSPIVVFAPGRINLIGEHTDYNLGYVLPAAIDKGIVMALQQSKRPISMATALDMEETHSFHLNSLKPISNGRWQNYIMGVVDEIQKKGKKLGPFNMVFTGDIPPGAGLSSSAALENALVLGLNELFQLGLTKKEMVYISLAAENNFVGVQCGIMDQYASMFGQKDCALFLDCKTLESEAIPILSNAFDVLLLDTKVTHSLADSAYNDRREVCFKVAQQMGVPSLRDLNLQTLLENKTQFSKDVFQKALFILEENKRVIDAVAALKNNDLRTFGSLLFQSHAGLQNQYKVSCEELDFLVSLAHKYEAVLGARMMGGGFGGCTINLVAKGHSASFIKKISQAYSKAFNRSLTPIVVAIGSGATIQ